MTEDEKRELYFSVQTQNIVRLFTTIILPGIGFIYVLIAIISDADIFEHGLLFLLALILIFGATLELHAKRSFNSSEGHDGQIVINTTDEGKTVFSLELDKDPDELKKQKNISFEVRTQQSTGYDDL